MSKPEVQESDVRWTIWLNHLTRAYEASSVSPGPGWEQVEVVPAERLEEFVEGLTQALNDHGVPAMPSWREAIDWLAAHGGER